MGRRLAFDNSRGRLWVVCRKCERWNLTPIEERWEAIEECERLFESARLRVATDNIGLARVREGLELVRVGSALRPEFAAWRYGDQFGKRRTRNILYTSAGILVVGGVVIGGISSGMIAGGGWGMYQGAKGLYDMINNRRTRLRLALPGTGEVVTLRNKHLANSELTRDDKDWALRLAYLPPEGGLVSREYKTVDLRGADALRVAGQLLPKINSAGGTKAQVQEAVQLIDTYPDPQRLFTSQARAVPSRWASQSRTSALASIQRLPLHVRLALEMASHEQQERQALEGELALLQEAWRQAEEVARIADDLFLPEGTQEKLDELKKTRDS
ncbi:MAG TPA: hypothetical protein VF483_07035 [Gemmatimonadaceae bacterium]